MMETKRWRDIHKWFRPQNDWKQSLVICLVALFVGFGLAAATGDSSQISKLEDQVQAEQNAKSEAVQSEREQKDLVEGLTENARLMDNRIISCQEALDVATSVGAEAIGRYSAGTETPEWVAQLLEKIDSAKPAADVCWDR